jgi:hypothetical protein
MISQTTAKAYKEELHPAFAGYLHDGVISNRDQLAAIFALADNGSIDFIYQENDLTKEITYLRKTNTKPKYEFEEKILNLIFKDKNEVSALQIKTLIENGSLKNILKNYIAPIKNLSLNEHNLEFGNDKNIKSTFIVNGVQIDSIELASQAKLPMMIASAIFSILGVIFTIVSIIEPSQSGLWIMGITFFLVGIGMGYTFFYGPKYVTFEIPENTAEYKQKYLELYEFLKTRPLDRRKLSDEFLSYAIAFGLNNHWNKEFGIETDIQVDGEFGGN